MTARSERVREEEHFRKVEGAMLHAEDAARCLDEAAKGLRKDGAAPYLIAALETAPALCGPTTLG